MSELQNMCMWPALQYWRPRKLCSFLSAQLVSLTWKVWFTPTRGAVTWHVHYRIQGTCTWALSPYRLQEGVVKRVPGNRTQEA